MVREADIERRVVNVVKEKFGIDSVKMGTTTSTGWPDRLFFIPGGRPLMIEFKKPGGKLSQKQKHIHARLTTAGYDVEVHDDFFVALGSISNRYFK